MMDYGMDCSIPQYGNFKLNYGLANEYIIARLNSKLKKEYRKTSQRIGIKVDKDWIAHLDKVSKVRNIVANRFLEGKLFNDWDEEYKKEWELLDGKWNR